ncbi:MAG: hypothetical protein QOF89_1759 [Acidobacteriota bacterium]|jgi:hypothetical protein|nr:hypothetical protein [Acidobacteriota bacterium]
MTPAAYVPYVAAEHDFTLQDLLEHLTARLGLECTLAQAEESAKPLPEIRVATSTPICIRIEANAERVYDDLGDLAEDAEGLLPAEWIDVLLRCTAWFDVQESEIEWVEPDENGVVELDFESELDLTLPDVRAVVLEIARFVDGYAYAVVNMEWLVTEVI